MSRTETLDNTKMTNGPITRILLSFAGPVLLGQLLQQLYNIADAAIVGQFSYVYCMLFLYRFMYRNKCSCVTGIWSRKE